MIAHYTCTYHCRVQGIGTENCAQIVQIKTRLCDQSLHFLPFPLHLSGALLHCKIKLFDLMTIIEIIFDPKFSEFCGMIKHEFVSYLRVCPLTLLSL